MQQFKDSLLKEKEILETELKKFAQKDSKSKDDWDTKYPNFGQANSGSNIAEEAADEVEEYATLLPIEHNLELRLRDVNDALKKIETGKYGLCEKCGNDISSERLEVYPEAKKCQNCGT